MSETSAVTEGRRPVRAPRKSAAPVRSSRRPVADVKSLRDYLASLDLGITPTVHVNGHAFSSALVTVDFGQPLKPAKLNQDQGAEFSDRLRKLAREIVNRDNANIRVSYDNINGVYWASIA
jgi:hypothetical protein